MGVGANVLTPGATRAEHRRQDTARELHDVVLLARVAPGQKVLLTEFARLGRATLQELEQALPHLVAGGLVTRDGDHLLIKPLENDAMFATLPRRMELEIKIVRAVATDVSDAQLQQIKESQALQRRCALLGDMDGMMLAERELERLLVEASGLYAEGAELSAIKVEFRRAWCAINRLRNFTNVADIRAWLVTALSERDPDASEAQVRVFFDHLLQTY